MCSSDANPDTSLLHTINFRAIPVLVAALLVVTAVPVMLGHWALSVKLGPEHAREVYETYYWISICTGVSVGLALLAGSLTYWLIARSITTPLTDMAERADDLVRSSGTTRFDETSPIREIRKISASFNGLFEAQERRVQELTGLVHAIMHDIRTPLSHMRNAADTVLNGPGGNTDAALTMIESCDTVSDIIGANAEITLHYNRCDTTPASEQDFTAIIRTGLDIFSTIAETKGIRLDVTLPDEPIVVPAHKAKLQSLVSNLLENALKFTPRGGTITVAAAKTDSGVSLTVSDTGCGISETDLPHIYERFYRADSSRHEPGSGLGLSLVHSIVTFYNGTIRCDSVPNRGTTFAVMLPLVRKDR